MPTWRRPLPLVALAGWVAPGLGHALLGQWRAATLMMGAILALYGGGLALTDFTAVDPELHGLEFIAHVFAGGPTALAAWLTDGLEPTRFLPYLDVGRLYVAVASLLNLVAATDAIEKTARLNHQYDTWRAQRRATLEATSRPAALELPPIGIGATDSAAAPDATTEVEGGLPYETWPTPAETPSQADAPSGPEEPTP